MTVTVLEMARGEASDELSLIYIAVTRFRFKDRDRDQLHISNSEKGVMLDLSQLTRV